MEMKRGEANQNEEWRVELEEGGGGRWREVEVEAVVDVE